MLCIAGRGPLDKSAAAMLAQLLGKHGLAARAAPYGAASRQSIDSLDVTGVAMVCISYLENSGSPSGLHYLVRRLRARLPRAKILVGLWPTDGQDGESDRIRTVVGADVYASNLKEAVDACVKAAHDAAGTVPSQHADDTGKDGAGRHEAPARPRPKACRSRFEGRRVAARRRAGLATAASRSTSSPMAQDTLHGVTPTPGRRAPAEPPPAPPGRVAAVMARLAAADPDPKAGLEIGDPYQLLVTVLMSAQSTGPTVGRVAQALFAVAPTPEAIVALGRERVAEIIKPVGLAENKSRHILGLSAMLLDVFGGTMPRTAAEMRRFPGIGRKTAEVTANFAYGEPVIGVDTHVVQGVEPDPPRAWPHARCGGGRASGGRAGSAQGRRPCLAVPPRARHLHGAPAGLRALHRGGSLRLARQDAGGRRRGHQLLSVTQAPCAAWIRWHRSSAAWRVGAGSRTR